MCSFRSQNPKITSAVWQRFDESRVRKAGLYWSSAPASRAYALESYEVLRRLFSAAAPAGNAAILWLA